MVCNFWFLRSSAKTRQLKVGMWRGEMKVGYPASRRSDHEKKDGRELLSRFHHVGMVVKNLDQAVRYLQGLGIGPFESSKLVHINRKMHGKPVPGDVKVMIQATRIGSIGIELLQPVTASPSPRNVWSATAKASATWLSSSTTSRKRNPPWWERDSP